MSLEQLKFLPHIFSSLRVKLNGPYSHKPRIWVLTTQLLSGDEYHSDLCYKQDIL